jgi:hypothetical protein
MPQDRVAGGECPQGRLELLLRICKSFTMSKVNNTVKEFNALP